MNNQIPFYCFSFSDGQISSKQKISSDKRRVLLPNNREHYIPVFTFGTMGHYTQISKVIPCFQLFSKAYGNEFCEKVANALIRYGDNYMIRYRLPIHYTITDLAVYYLFNINKDEILINPQNRFYTFYKKEHKPYDYILYTDSSLQNEVIITNTLFPTFNLSNIKLSISSFSDEPFLSIEEFEKNIEQNFFNDDGSPLFNADFFSGVEYRNNMDLSDNLLGYLDPFINENYIVNFGIQEIDSIFCIVPMGLYMTTNMNQDKFLKRVETFKEIYLSDIVNYCSNYNENGQSYLCKGIFTFNSKIIKPYTIDNFSTQRHGTIGQSEIPWNIRSYINEEKKKQNKKNKKNVKKMLKH
jgi:hypothetical protein